MKYLENVLKKKFPIQNDIVYVANPKNFDDVCGFERLSKKEKWDFSAEYLKSLPLPKKSTEGIHWKRHAKNFFFIINKLDLKNKLVLDLGAQRCWSTRHLALKGAKAVALDIDDTIRGLRAADVFFDEIYFDRVCADMNDLPFNDSSFDIVFCTGALHHSDNLNKTISEVTRILKPKGVFAMTNEPCGKFIAKENVQTPEGIHEHNYRYVTYTKILNKYFSNVQVFPESGPKIMLFALGGVFRCLATNKKL